jgi:hypothetical protein
MVPSSRAGSVGRDVWSVAGNQIDPCTQACRAAFLGWWALAHPTRLCAAVTVANAVVETIWPISSRRVDVCSHGSGVRARKTLPLQGVGSGAGLGWATHRVRQGRPRRSDGGVGADRATVGVVGQLPVDRGMHLADLQAEASQPREGFVRPGLAVSVT